MYFGIDSDERPAGNQCDSPTQGAQLQTIHDCADTTDKERSKSLRTETNTLIDIGNNLQDHLEKKQMQTKSSSLESENKNQEKCRRSIDVYPEKPSIPCGDSFNTTTISKTSSKQLLRTGLAYLIAVVIHNIPEGLAPFSAAMGIQYLVSLCV